MEYAGDSKTGLVRSINQDSIIMLSSEKMGIFAVADGMGGHVDGEKASQAVINGLKNWWNNIVINQCENDFMKLVSSIKNCMQEVNESIFKEYYPHTICGTTASILFMYNDSYAIFNVGDSRIYELNKRKFIQSTIDDVWENDIWTKKKYTKKEIELSSKKGKLVNAIGTAKDLMVNIKTDVLNPNSTFLICSDGLYKMVSHRDIYKIVKKNNRSASVQTGVEELIKKAYAAGASDNVSIIMIQADN